MKFIYQRTSGSPSCWTEWDLVKTTESQLMAETIVDFMIAEHKGSNLDMYGIYANGGLHNNTYLPEIEFMISDEEMLTELDCFDGDDSWSE
jgi:hypothetical protein